MWNRQNMNNGYKRLHFPCIVHTRGNVNHNVFASCSFLSVRCNENSSIVSACFYENTTLLELYNLLNWASFLAFTHIAKLRII